MFSNELIATILRLYEVEKWPVGKITEHLMIHRSVVERALRQSAGKTKKPRKRSVSKLDDYTPFLVETLQKYPSLCASTLHGMARERGMRCSPSHFRALVVQLRPKRRPEAFLRLRTLPGEQGQVDWAHFGELTIGRAVRKLYAFVMVLASSRRIFLRFGLDIGMTGFLEGHNQAFETFGGVPRVLLYDNLKSAVIQRIGDAIQFNVSILEFAQHYRYEPRPVAVRRGNEKGRVERAIRYIRYSFFAGREFKDLADINAQADLWCVHQSEERQWPQDHTLKVRDAFELEKMALLPLPDDSFPAAQRIEVHVQKTPYFRFDLNNYSVPHAHVQSTLTVLATATELRVLAGSTEIARHLRCFDKGQTIENLLHIEPLVDEKRHARQHRAQDRVIRAVPEAEKLLVLLAKRGDSIGSCVGQLGKLLDSYGQEDLTAAVSEAMRLKSPHPNNIRLLLEKIRYARGLPPPSAAPTVTDPKLLDIHVQTHDLAGYDRISTTPQTADKKEPQDD